MNLRGFHASVNPRFEGGILDFMDGISDFMENHSPRFFKSEGLIYQGFLDCLPYHIYIVIDLWVSYPIRLGQLSVERRSHLRTLVCLEDPTPQ